MNNSPAHPANRAQAEAISAASGIEVTAEQVYSGNVPEEAQAAYSETLAAQAEVRQASAVQDIEGAAADALDIGFWEGVGIRFGFTEVTDIRTPEQIQAATVAAIEPLRDAMRGAESEAARYEALKGALNSAGQTEIVTALNGAGELVQNALGNAFAYNDEFANRVVESFTAEGDQASMVDVLQGMQPAHAPYVADVLNTIASDPNYDMARLDAVVNTVGTMNTAQTALEAARAANDAETIAEQQGIIDAAGQQLIEDVRNAGGNVPAIASMRPEMMLSVLGDILNGGDISSILGNVGDQLGLSGQELADFMAVMGPIAGIIQAVIEPYAELYQQYSPAMPGLIDRGQNLMAAIGGSDADRVSFTAPATTTNPERVAAVETETSELTANGTFSGATTPSTEVPTGPQAAPVIPQQQQTMSLAH